VTIKNEAYSKDTCGKNWVKKITGVRLDY